VWRSSYCGHNDLIYLPIRETIVCRLVSWSLTSLFSTNTAISETNVCMYTAVNLAGILGDAGMDPDGLVGGTKDGVWGEEYTITPPTRGGVWGGPEKQTNFCLKWGVLVNQERYYTTNLAGTICISVPHYKFTGTCAPVPPSLTPMQVHSVGLPTTRSDDCATAQQSLTLMSICSHQ